MASSSKRPVQDLGVPKPKVKFRAGGKRQVTTKAELSDTGTVGFTPGSGYRPDMHMEEAPQPTGRVPGSDDLEYAPQARPTPGTSRSMTRRATGERSDGTWTGTARYTGPGQSWPGWRATRMSTPMTARTPRLRSPIATSFTGTGTGRRA